MDEMDDKNPTFDPVAFLDEQRKDTALQLSALGDRVTRGELAGVWVVAMPLDGEHEIVGIVEHRHEDLLKALRDEGNLACYDDLKQLDPQLFAECLAKDFATTPVTKGPPAMEPIADKNLSFSTALVAAKAGLTIRREGWNGAGLNVRLHRPRPGGDEATTVPLLVIVNPPTHPTAPNLRASWVPSQTDMLAEDWLVVPGVIYA